MSATVVVMLHLLTWSNILKSFLHDRWGSNKSNRDIIECVIHDRIDHITIKKYHSGHICMFLRRITAMLIGHTRSDVHRSQQTRR